MTNYNDGKWHGWNGGECPVHPETVVECVVLCVDGVSKGLGVTKSKDYTWHNMHNSPIIAFRVIKEHKEPREFWVVQGAIGKHVECGYKKPYAFKVREVIEE